MSYPVMCYPVLVVDDEAQIRKLVRSMLSSEGVPAIEAHDGASAIAAVKAAGGRISLLLTDVHMEDATGVDLAQAITSVFPCIPVLFMSAWGMPPEVIREVPRRALLQKPFSAALLHRAVTEALGVQR